MVILTTSLDGIKENMSKLPIEMKKNLKVALNTNDNNNMMLQKFEDTKGVIWSCKLKTDNTMATRKKDKRTNNDLQNTTQKTKESY